MLRRLCHLLGMSPSCLRRAPRKRRRMLAGAGDGCIYGRLCVQEATIYSFAWRRESRTAVSCALRVAATEGRGGVGGSEARRGCVSEACSGADC